MADGDQSTASSTPPTLPAFTQGPHYLQSQGSHSLEAAARDQEEAVNAMVTWFPGGGTRDDRGSLGVAEAEEKLTGRGGGPQGEGESTQRGRHV